MDANEIDVEVHFLILVYYFVRWCPACVESWW
jgi:hypothetical protein